MSACAAPRHQDDPPEAAPSARLCGPCTTGLAADLRDLPALYAQLGGILEPGSSEADNRHFGAGDGMHYNEPAFEAMSQIYHDCAMWAAELAGAFGWDGNARTWRDWDPAMDSRADLGPRVTFLAGWLHPLVQKPRVLARTDAGAMAGAFADDRHRAEMLLNPPPAGRIIIPAELNWCPRCQGTAGLRIVYAGRWERRPVSVCCSRCGYGWGVGQQLQTLGWMILRRRDTAGAA